MCVFNNGLAVILMLIDMSAAFDTVDYDIMLQHFKTHLSIENTVACLDTGKY